MAPDHYAQCPVRNSTNWPAPGPCYCLCYLIAKVDKDLRTQIAKDIRHMKPAWSQTYDGKWLVGREMAARIAEGDA